MSTHRRAWKQRAGVVVALVAGALLAVPATPAWPQMSGLPGSVTVNAGSDATVTVRVTAGQRRRERRQISLSGLPSGVSCASGCGDVNFPGGLGNPRQDRCWSGSRRTTTPATRPRPSGGCRGRLGPGHRHRLADRQGQGRSAAAAADADRASRSPARWSSRPTARPVPNAIVILQDSAGKTATTRPATAAATSASPAPPANPIAPGRIDLGAIVDNVQADQDHQRQRRAVRHRAADQPGDQGRGDARAPPRRPAPRPPRPRTRPRKVPRTQPSEDASPGAPANAAQRGRRRRHRLVPDHPARWPSASPPASARSCCSG